MFQDLQDILSILKHLVHPVKLTANIALMVKSPD